MKQTILILLVISLVAIAGCTAPPEDAVRAEVNDDSGDAMEGDSMEDDSHSGDSMMEEDGDAMEGDAMEGDGMMEDSSLTKKAWDQEKSSFEFEGYGPGKSHIGTFDEGEAFLYYDSEGNLVKIEGTIQTDSVNTGISGLDNHLKNADFFEVETYPTITAVSSKVDMDAGEITGDLTFKGVTKEITYPVEFSEDGVSADFVISLEAFGVTYTGVNDEVRIAFSFFPSG